MLIKIYSFVQENAFEKVVFKMAAILSRPQCIKKTASHLFSAYPFTWTNADLFPLAELLRNEFHCNVIQLQN